MKVKPERNRELKHASWIGIIGNSLLAVVKIVIGFISGSLAVIGDGIDSLSDVFTYFITLFTTRLIGKPPDSKYPYGYRKAETISTKVLSFIIFFAGAQLLISTASRLISGEEREMPSIIAIYVTILSIIGKVILATWQFKIGKRTDSSMIIANAKNMRNDILISASVLVGLFFTFILKMPVLDVITAMLVSIWIIKVAFNIFQESNLELMDGMQDTEMYFKVFKEVDKIKKAHNPHRIRIRKLADVYLIAMDIEVDGGYTVAEAHNIAKDVENMIKQNIPNVYDVMIHIEPYGNIESDEVYGISKDNIK
ncbi:MAG: cation transporter [Bacteroidales bacterium]|nr:cation transporter [Bacteroidales bacterium]